MTTKQKNWWRLIIIVRWFQQIPVFSGFRFKIDPNVDMTPLDFKDWNWCSSLRRLYHCKGATNPMSSKKQRNAGTYAASKLPFFCEKAENEQNITRYKNEKNSLWAPKLLLWWLDDFEGKFLATRKCGIGLRKIRNHKILFSVKMESNH